MSRSKPTSKRNKKTRKNKLNTDSLRENHTEFIENNRLILKLQQKLRSEKHVFTEEFNKIVLSANDDERIQSIDSIETYAYGMSKHLICEKEEIKCNNIIKQYKNE